MRCEDFQEDLSAWIDGELTPAEEARLAVHLDSCPECRQVLHEFKETSLLARNLAIPRAPAFVTDAAMRLVRGMPQAARASWMLHVRRLLFEPFWPKVGIEVVGFAAAMALAVFVAHQAFTPSTNDSGTVAGAQSKETRDGQAPAGDTYRLAGVEAPATVYDFRDPNTHGRRNIGTFSESERLAWQRGAWHHEYRFGRDGWWWEVDGAWYWYDKPADGPPMYVSGVRFVNPS